MVNISENGQYFSGYDNAIHKDQGISTYVDDWAWDTYRAQHPLQTLINPQEQRNKLTSYIRMYEQSGSIPLFPTLSGDLGCMNGNHPSAIICDAYRKGMTGFDVEKAFEGLKKRAMESTMLPWKNGPLTVLDEFYHKNGYFPALKVGQKEYVDEVDELESRQAVSVTLGHSYDDWCLAMLAKDLGHEDEYKFFLERAANYKNLFDPEIGFFAPRDEDGNWVRPFDPKLSGGFGGRDYFAENNAWTYLFDVQHDIQGLIQLLGGKEKFISKLDALFTEDCGTRKSTYLAQFPDATGLVGQFAMGNEPSLHIPYLYNYAGAPWKTQKRIRMLMDLWFTNSPFGMCGDEDGGGISSFYVFSAMGFYPVTPGSPYYNIGSPLFSKTVIDIGEGKSFSIEANNCSKKNKYIQRAELNGIELNNPYFSHDDIAHGGKLILEMGPRPNFEWGKDSEGPYSMSLDERD
jgi:predicted alpha-1,2-mannosidase